MVRHAKDSIAISKQRTQKEGGGRKPSQLSRIRNLVITLTLVTIPLGIGYICDEVYQIFKHPHFAAVNLSIMFLYIIYLLVEANIIYFRRMKLIRFCIIIESVSNILLIVFTVLQAYNLDEGEDLYDVMPILACLGAMEIVFIIRALLFVPRKRAIMEVQKTNLQSALLSQRTFNEKLLQSLVPEDMPQREEHIQVSLDEIEQISNQNSDIEPPNHLN